MATLTPAQAAQLLADVTALQQLTQQQTATIAQLQAAQPPAAPAAAPDRPKVNKPEEFDGRSESLENFIHQCTLFLSIGNYNNQSKITLTLSYMTKGSALAWAEQKLAEYMAGQPNAQPPVAPWTITWDDFLVDLRASFGDISRAQTARLRLPNLQQTSSVDDYNVAFMGLYPLTGFNDITGIELYKKGLKNPILRRILNEVTPPADFAAWRTRASHYDRVDKEIRETERQSTTSTPKSSQRHGRTITTASSSTPSSTTHRSSTSASAPTTSTTAAPTKVKQERVEPTLAAQRKAAHLCIRCAKPGHYADKCPNPINHDPMIQVADRRGLPSGRGAHAHRKRRRVTNMEAGEQVESTSGSK